MSVERPASKTNPLVPVDPNINAQKASTKKTGAFAGYKITNETKKQFLEEVDNVAHIALRDFDKKKLLKMKEKIGNLKERVVKELPPHRIGFFARLFKLNLKDLPSKVRNSLDTQEKRIDQKIVQIDKQADEAAKAEKTKQLAQKNSKHAELVTKFEGLQADQKQLDEDLTKLTTSLTEATASTFDLLEKLAGEITQLESTNQKLENGVKVLKKSYEDMKKRIESIQDELETDNFQLVALKAKIAREERRENPDLQNDFDLIKAQTDLNNLQKKIIERNAENRRLERGVPGAEEKIKEIGKKIDDNLAVISEKEKKLGELKQNYHTSEEEIESQKKTIVDKMATNAKQQKALLSDKIALEGEINTLNNSLLPPSSTEAEK